MRTLSPLLLSLFFLYSMPIFAQSSLKKVMDEEVYDIWNRIQNTQISNNGQWVAYNTVPGKGDAQLHLYQLASGQTISFPRAIKATFSDDNQYLMFTIKPFTDSLLHKRRMKVKEKDLPKDSLAVYQLTQGKLLKTPNLKSLKVPQRWSGWIAYQIEESKKIERDSSQQTEEKKKTKKEKREQAKKKKKKKKKGEADLILRRLNSGLEDTIVGVSHYRFAKKGHRLVLTTSGDEQKGILPGVYLYDCDQALLQPLFRSKGKYPKLVIDEAGKQVAFIADLDTTKAQIRPFQLYHWQLGMDSAQLQVTQAKEKNWLVSEHYSPSYAQDGSLLYFGMAPPPILKDTSLLPEEIVNVEVWNYKDQQLHTQQNVQLKEERKRTYTFVLHTNTGQNVQLADRSLPEVRLVPDRNANTALGYNENDYLLSRSWEGGPSYKDLYALDIKSGNRKSIAKKVRGSARISPSGQYIYWYAVQDSLWQVYRIADATTRTVADNNTTAFYNELNDLPAQPWAYGLLGWTEDDQHMLVYDRYDIWKIDPAARKAPQRLTQGREKQVTYRYIRLDREEYSIAPNAELLLHQFDQNSKESGYARLSLKSGQLKSIAMGKYSYNRSIKKARKADQLVFTRENFRTFPNLQISKLDFANPKVISDANPQQKDYRWGDAELYQWTSLTGEKLSGTLVKPEGFDPSKKYPMIVNFYERSSDRLYRHRAPFPHRSTINYSFYSNKGYLLFNPDVPYRIGYPGESAQNAVISGVTALINEGFVDEKNIGVQGHSWGGYQIAHLITRTNIFKCAESGAPVVNMFSAYGGIRWGSGLSRMFQYEKTQSRIGGTIWEYPLRYLENSPLFFIDKIETPVLILHNDNDGAVPWYQGIEFFVALRRLGKPAWMLNYNNEPHWPLKRQNRIDFNIRMQQFFDHYLQGAAEPAWMKKGIPAIEKGVNKGYELMEPSQE